MTNRCREPHDKQNSRWLKDGRGIELCRVCDDCEDEKRRTYENVLGYYDETDVDETIEPEGY